jgi:hypothetical protein
MFIILKTAAEENHVDFFRALLKNGISVKVSKRHE